MQEQQTQQQCDGAKTMGARDNQFMAIARQAEAHRKSERVRKDKERNRRRDLQLN